MARGNGLAVVVVIVIVVAILLIVLFRQQFERSPSDFGTWNEFQTTLCLNDGQGCTVPGTSQRFRTCNPNTVTGNGCITMDGRHTFLPETINVPCTPICFESVWDDDITTPCTVYDDQAGTIVSANQTCRNNNPDQYTYTKVSRTCVSADASGANGCVKQDGTLAVIGESESISLPCSTIPECFPLTWQPCGPTGLATDNCGGPASDCGRLIPSTTPALCLEETSPGVFVDNPSLCNPLDDPGPCNINCFNYPCTTYPAGYGAFISLFGPFVEFFDIMSGNYIEHDLALYTFAIAPNGVLTTSGNPVVVITVPGHSFSNMQTVDISGLIGTGGVPAADLNQRHQISNVTPISFEITVDTTPNSSGTGGGAAGVAFQDQLARAMAPEPVLPSTGPVDTMFSNTGAADRMRFRLVPSQNEAVNAGFYMVANIPYNAEVGVVNWNGTNLVVEQAPILMLGQTYDDVPGLQMFTIDTTPSPFRLKLYTAGGFVGPEVYACGAMGCIDFSLCDEPLAGSGTCV